MHEAQMKLFATALSVMNRGLSNGSRAAALFEGAREGDDVFVTVVGANPDEDDAFAMRMRGQALEMTERCNPHRDERRREGWTIRLDDLERIVDRPDHYAANPDLMAKLVIRGPI